ncbi:MAG: protein kinase [Planctomycetota bacterium]
MRCPHCDAELPPDGAECDCRRARTPEVDLSAEETGVFDPPPLRPGWPDTRPVPFPPADRFEVRQELGRGGFGIVWMARRHGDAGGPVAVRRLIAPNADAERGIQDFLGEANAIRRLEHPGIAGLIEVDRDEYGPYVVTEYVEGHRLDHEIDRRGPFETEDVIRIGGQLCQALHHAHTLPDPVVHGRLDTTNILLVPPQDHPRILDFGLSSGHPGGKTPADDILALGTVLGQMVTSWSPSLRAVEDEIPPALRPVIRKATADAPEDRYATMEELREALLRPVEETTPSPPLVEVRREDDIAEVEERIVRRLSSARYREAYELCRDANERFPGHPRLAELANEARGRMRNFKEHLKLGREALGQADWARAEECFREAEEFSPADDGRALEGVRKAREGAFHSHLDRAETEIGKRRWKKAGAELSLARKIRPRDGRPGDVEAFLRRRRRGVRRRRVLLGLAVVLIAAGWLTMHRIAIWRVSRGDVGTAALLHDWFAPVMLEEPDVASAIADHWTTEAERLAEEDPRRALKCLTTAAAYRPGEPLTRLRGELLLVLAETASPEESRQAVRDARSARSLAEQAGLADLVTAAEACLAKCEESARAQMLAGFVPAADSMPVSRTPECRLRFSASQEIHVVEAVLVDETGETPLRRAGAEFVHDCTFAEEGTKEWTLTIRDDLGIEATFPEPVRATCDATPPTVVAERAEEGVVLADRRNFEFRFSVSDRSLNEGGFPLASVRARVNDGEFEDVEPPHTLVVRIPEDETGATVTVRAEDAAGNPAEAVFTIRLVTGKPTTRILVPEDVHHDPGRNAYCTTKVGLTLRGVTRADGELSFVLGRRAGDGQEERTELSAEHLVKSDDPVELEFPVDLAPGDNVFVLRVTDGFGNEEVSDPVTICVDREAPRFGDLTPKAGTGELLVTDEDGLPHLLIPAPRPLRIDVEDASGPIQLLVNGRALEKREIELTPGDHDLSIRAIDALGHESGPVRLRFRCLVLPGTVKVEVGRLVHVSGGERIELRYVPEGQMNASGRYLPRPLLVAARKATVDGGFSFDAARTRAGQLGLALLTEEEWIEVSRLGAFRPADMFEGEPEWVARTGIGDLGKARDAKYPEGWQATCGGKYWAKSPSPKTWAKDRAPQPIAARFVLRFP